MDSEFLSWNKRRKILESSKQVILRKIRELEESETRVIELRYAEKVKAQPEEERQLMAKRSEQLMEVARKYEHRRQVEEFQMDQEELEFEQLTRKGEPNLPLI